MSCVSYYIADKYFMSKFTQKTTIKITDSYITHDGYLLKNNGVLLAGLVNGTVENLSFRKRLQLFWQHYLKPRIRQPKRFFQDFTKEAGVRMEGDYVWITDNWSHGYYHWIADVLPRLIAGEKELEERTLLLPSHLKDKEFVTASLECLGVTEVAFVSPDGKTHVTDLTVIPHVAASGQHDKAILQELRRRLRSAFLVDVNNSLSEKLYISRSKAARRRVINESELIPVLQESGFEVVHFEGLSWEEQARKCANAKYLIGLHGAGLVNMIFIPAGSHVLELISKNYQNRCYERMASELDIEHDYHECESEKSIFSENNRDVIVNPKSIEINIKL